MLMAAHRENIYTPGVFSSKSVQQMARQAEALFARSVYCLNLSEVPKALQRDVGYEGALALKEIFDRIDLPPFHLIPDAQAIEAEEEQEKIPEFVRWRVPNTDIVIARVEAGPRQGEYLFSPQTVARLPEFYAKVKDLPYKDNTFISYDFLDFYRTTPGRLLPPKWSQWLPAWSTAEYLSQTLWQWGALAVSLLVTLIFMRALYRGFRHRADTLSPARRLWGWVVFTLVAAGTIVVLFYVLDEHINVHGSVIYVLDATLPTIVWVVLGIAAFLVGAAWAETIVASPTIDPEGIQASSIRALGGLVGFVAMTAIVIYGLSRVGVSLIPLLTGVGVGGLAVALAARPTIANIIGSFMIFVDKPYRVGQRVKVMGQDGTVEAIGLRSTRIRLLSGHLTAIPNERMAAVEIENIARRPYIKRTLNITITYDTPPAKITRALEILREILAVPNASDPEPLDSPGEGVGPNTTAGDAAQPSHPNEAINQPDFPPRVSFNDLNADSLNLLVLYWYHPPEYWDYLDHATWVNLQIMERFNAEGIDFAFPTQTLHLARDDKRPLPVSQRQGSK
jgi:MscS family membrane protein